MSTKCSQRMPRSSLRSAVPAPVVTDEAGVEPVHLWRRDDLGGAAGVERAHHVDDECRLQHRQVVGDGRLATDLAGCGEASCLEHAAALSEQQARGSAGTTSDARGGTAPGCPSPNRRRSTPGSRARAALRPGRREAGRRAGGGARGLALPKSTRSQTIIGVSHTVSRRPVSVSRNLAVASRVEEPVARTRVSGKWSAAIFNSSEGFARRWISSRTMRLPLRASRNPSGSSISRRVRGSSQSKYSTSSRLRQRNVLPARRTPASQSTDRRRHAVSIASTQCCRLTIRKQNSE